MTIKVESHRQARSDVRPERQSCRNLRIVDDLLPKKALENIISAPLLQSNLYYGVKSYELSEIKVLHPLIEEASIGYKLPFDTMYDVWQQVSTRPTSWHEDLVGGGLYPLFTCIFYLKIEEMVGGRLLIEGHKPVEPRSNRLVVFGPRVKHYVEPFTGLRQSIMINPLPTRNVAR